MIEFFLVIGLTLFMGFAATIIFERTKISTVLILMLFGFILGPVTGIIDASPDSIIVSISQFIATLALIILLFDGGMMLDIFKVVKAIPRSTFYTIVTFLISVILVTVFAMFALGWPLLHGLLLGAVLGGVSSAIVIAMIEKAGVSDETKALVTIESSITDALCIIGAMLVIEIIISSSIGAGDIGHILLSSFLLALFIGAISAVLWIAITNRLMIEQYAYMLTLAMVFIVYGMTEGVAANGGFAVFTFGLVIGNARTLAKRFNLRTDSLVSPIVRILQEEVTFFVRTFFFVFIGILLLPSYFTFYVILVSALLTFIILLSRVISGRFILKDNTAKDRTITTYMLPRGLAAAVLATLPPLYGITIAEFQPIVFGVIVLTNVVATAGIFFFGGARPLMPRLRPYLGQFAELLFAEGEESGGEKPAEGKKETVEGKEEQQAPKKPSPKKNNNKKKAVKAPEQES